MRVCVWGTQGKNTQLEVSWLFEALKIVTFLLLS